MTPSIFSNMRRPTPSKPRTAVMIMLIKSNGIVKPRKLSIRSAAMPRIVFTMYFLSLIMINIAIIIRIRATRIAVRLAAASWVIV